MLSWFPLALAFIFWALLVYTVISKLIHRVRSARRGHLPRTALAGHLTADFISLAVGLAAAFLIQWGMARWVRDQPWKLGPVLGIALQFVSAFLLIVLFGWLYRRLVDGRVRTFMMTQPAADEESGEAEAP